MQLSQYAEITVQPVAPNSTESDWLQAKCNHQ